jgi:hypothetical protein
MDSSAWQAYPATSYLDEHSSRKPLQASKMVFLIRLGGQENLSRRKSNVRPFVTGLVNGRWRGGAVYPSGYGEGFSVVSAHTVSSTHHYERSMLPVSLPICYTVRHDTARHSHAHSRNSGYRQSKALNSLMPLTRHRSGLLPCFLSSISALSQHQFIQPYYDCVIGRR